MLSVSMSSRRTSLIFSRGTIDKVRLLYDCSQATARIVVRSKEDLEVPLVSLIEYSALSDMLTLSVNVRT
jgi:hypothetical protein